MLDAELPDAGELLSAINALPHDQRPDVVLLKTLLGAGTGSADLACVRATLLKPVHPGELLHALDRKGEGGEAEALRSSQQSVQPFAGLRVLLAEDDPVNQHFSRIVLQRAGIDVTLVTNGRQAVDAVLEQPYDLVLMDLMMPEVDGLTATGEIRRREVERQFRVPILAMTASVSVEDRKRCEEIGMDGFLQKPLNLDRVAENIDDLKKRGLMGGDDPTVEEPAGDPDTDLHDEVAELFAEIAPEYLATLKTAVADRDRPAIQASAHSLKGAASCIGAEELEELLLHHGTRSGRGSTQ